MSLLRFCVKISPEELWIRFKDSLYQAEQLAIYRAAELEIIIEVFANFT